MKLAKVRLSFPALFTPKTFPGADAATAKFQGTFLFPKTDKAMVKKIVDEMKSVAKAKWGNKWEAVYKQLDAQERICLRDGDLKPDSDGYEGMMYVSSSTGTKPTVLDRNRTPLDADAGRPYGGCFVNAVVDIWAQDNQYGKRLNCTLRGVQFDSDGDAFAASAPASVDDFDDLGCDEDDVSDETEGTDISGLM